MKTMCKHKRATINEPFGDKQIKLGEYDCVQSLEAIVLYKFSNLHIGSNLQYLFIYQYVFMRTMFYLYGWCCQERAS